MIVDVHVLFYRLIRIQRSKFSFNYSLCARDSRIHEVLVHFELSSVLLNSLEKCLTREVFYDLIFFVPFAHCSGVVAKERANSLTNSFKVRYLNLFFADREPMVYWQGDWGNEIGLSTKKRPQVSLQATGE